MQHSFWGATVHYPYCGAIVPYLFWCCCSAACLLGPTTMPYIFLWFLILLVLRRFGSCHNEPLFLNLCSAAWVLFVLAQYGIFLVLLQCLALLCYHIATYLLCLPQCTMPFFATIVQRTLCAATVHHLSCAAAAQHVILVRPQKRVFSFVFCYFCRQGVLCDTKVLCVLPRRNMFSFCVVTIRHIFHTTTMQHAFVLPHSGVLFVLPKCSMFPVLPPCSLSCWYNLGTVFFLLFSVSCAAEVFCAPPWRFVCCHGAA